VSGPDAGGPDAGGPAASGPEVAGAGGPDCGAGGALGSAGTARPYTRAFGAAVAGSASSAAVGGATRLAVGTDALADTGRAVPVAGGSSGDRGCGTADESATACAAWES
jgi:N-carbamoyl-L-amino-acid hydrolase